MDLLSDMDYSIILLLDDLWCDAVMADTRSGDQMDSGVENERQ